MNSNSIRFRTAALFSAVVLASVMVTSCAVTTPTAALPTPASTPEVNSPSVETSAALASLEGSLENIYTQVSPSVVNISVIQETTTTSLFGFQTQQEQQATGSGFIWDRNGNIVTNNHVVENSQDIRVTFSDGAVVSAQIVGTDPNSDLAVIKVDRPSEALPPVTMAPAENVKVGQLAIAIGNPYGLQGSMTLGIVSALGRSLPVESSSSTQSSGYTIPGIIQTDAPINPGNSGGILINDQAEVIGVTSAIISPVDASAGIGFAIPAAIVSKVVPALIETGQYQHPYIGISGTTLLPEVVNAMNLPEGQLGALVISVTSNGPADKAGIKGSDSTTTINGQDYPIGGDVITAIDSHPVKSFDDLVSYLAMETEVGQTVELSIIRDGKPMTVQVELQARPTQAQQTAQQTNLVGAYLGIHGVSLTTQIAQAANLPETLSGVLIEQVVAGSPAADAGLVGGDETTTVRGQEITIGGDVLMAVDNIAVATIEDLQALLGQMHPDQQVTLTIFRAGDSMQIDLTLGQPPT